MTTTTTNVDSVTSRAIWVALLAVGLSIGLAIILLVVGAISGDPIWSYSAAAAVVGAIIFAIFYPARVFDAERREHHRKDHKRIDAEVEVTRERARALAARADYYDSKTKILNGPKPQTFTAIPAPQALPRREVIDQQADDLRTVVQATAVAPVGTPTGTPTPKPTSILDDEVELDPPSYVRRAAEQGESITDHQARIMQLGTLITRQVRDKGFNPRQEVIKQLIDMRPGGLLRSNGDITEALNYLASLVPPLVSPSVAPGQRRYFLDREGKALIFPERKSVTKGG